MYYERDAGILEVRLRFYPDLYESTDDANLSTGDPFALVGILNFEVIATPQLRGEPTNILVQISDHMGVERGYECSVALLSIEHVNMKELSANFTLSLF